MYKILKTVLSDVRPQATDVLWIKPVEGGFGFYIFESGKWKLLRVMNGKDSDAPEDDEPYDLNGVGAKKLADLEDVDMEGI